MKNPDEVDQEEISKFEAMAQEWWDPEGKFKPLHMLHPCRLGYIVSQIKAQFQFETKKLNPFEGLRILDIGCGGGLLSEPMARLGASVVGVDPVDKNIRVAELHAKQVGLNIDYRVSTAEELLKNNEIFDVILNMEVIEHVPSPEKYVNTCSELLRSGGLMTCSTINRNPKSYLWAIIGAEYVMRWLPKHTHEWKKFITPKELSLILENNRLKLVDTKGFVFNFIQWDWKLSAKDFSVNYVTTTVKS
ncbi:MAG: bifunctional 3-demethylubiquinol 3-O-methyltransferase/2-polyprenyl-6-hydroxyphenol methylase [Rhodobacteraceae bacterium]|nr:bifunctional 3-demethylubiquinol 3-O-methyltransferase/2-polyprenyl-6-hydroxyphenol methylase [Paracoccaceae bacterium]